LAHGLPANSKGTAKSDYRSAWMTEELTMFQDAGHKFFEKECVPHEERWSKQQMPDRAIWNRLGAIGMLCASISEQYGGGGRGFPDLVSAVYGPALLPYPVEMQNAEAAVRAADKGTLKKGGVSDEVRKASLDTLMGKMQFDDKGDVVGSVAMPMAQHQNGQVAIVWPKASATAKMNFPAVPW
jgi:hypothetical protein